MILENNAKGQKYHHHEDAHHHPHADSGTPAIGVQKSGTREIKVVRRVLDVNEKMAAENRKIFAEAGVFVLNVMSKVRSLLEISAPPMMPIVWRSQVLRSYRSIRTSLAVIVIWPPT
jgi:hypothetical protein